MGKAARWFRSLLGIKSQDSPSQSETKPKRRWSFGKSHRERDRNGAASNPSIDTWRASQGSETPVLADSEGAGVDPNKQAIAVAAATAAVAEAAVAAAHAAAAVVRLTSGGMPSAPAAYVSGTSTATGTGIREQWGAVKIQSHFRGYLARRALRALKGLVKLQALVRGHIVRKQTADMLLRLQALLRAQARARLGRAQTSDSLYSSLTKSSQLHNTGPATPETLENAIQTKSSPILKRNGSKSTVRAAIVLENVQNDRKGLPPAKFCHTNDQNSDKVLEIDNGKLKPPFTPNRRNHNQSSSHHHFSSDRCSHSCSTSKASTAHDDAVPSPSSGEVQSLTPLKFPHETDDSPFCTADNSPQYLSASSRGVCSRKGPFTPTKSDGSRSYLSGYSDHPNFMACTESSRAKIRSLSAPRQRPQNQSERSGLMKRYSVHGSGDTRASTQRVMSSALYGGFANKVYPGSGRLDRLGMPARGDDVEFSTDLWNRY